MTTERRYDIDWLRVIAIGLLLIYHIAIVFQPWALFIGFIKSEQSLESLWVPMTLLNVWRIPLLFFVSGMGVYFAIRKRNWPQLMLERARRILLPFLFGIIAITPLHFLVFQKNYGLPLGYSPHPGHLWFLGNIFVYVLFLSPLFFYLKNRGESGLMKAWSSLMRHPLGPLSVAIFFVIEALLVQPQIFEQYAQTWHGFYLGLLAFLFGFLFVYSGNSFWKTVLKWRWFYVALAAAFYTLRLSSFDLQAPSYLMAIESHCWILGIFGFGYRYLNKPSQTLSYLSRAAYPVYILHMFALYLGAFLILPLKLPLMLQFVCIVTFTGVLCFVLYEFVIRRIGILRPLFGLKGKRQEVQPTQLSHKLG